MAGNPSQLLREQLVEMCPHQAQGIRGLHSHSPHSTEFILTPQQGVWGRLVQGLFHLLLLNRHSPHGAFGETHAPEEPEWPEKPACVPRTVQQAWHPRWPSATGQLPGEEVVCVADVIRALGASGIWLAVPRCVVRLEAAGRHRRGDERDEHWGGLGSLGDQLTQRVGRMHTRPAFFQSLHLPQLPEPSHRHTETNHTDV